MLENDDCRPIKRKEHCIRYYLINPTGPAGVTGPTPRLFYSSYTF